MDKYIKKKFIVLGLIILLAAFLRIYRLGDVPASFHRDEAFFGYNAYSVLMTGRDVSSNFLPIHLSSFLYSPAGYVYFAVPVIQILGLTEFAVRFPSAIFGVLTIFITYFLTKKIFFKFQYALSAAFLLAVSPWHINLSRTTTENTIVVFFVILGVITWIIWIEKKNLWMLFISFFLFSLTLGIYQAPRAFLPIFIPFLIILYYRQMRKKEVFITFFLFFIMIIVPLFYILSSQSLSARLRMVSIFHSDQTKLVLIDQIHEDGVNNIPVGVARLFHNKLGGYSDQFFQNYFKHFSYDFLFYDVGFPERYRIPQLGLLYRFELIFLLFGLLAIMRRFSKESLLLIGWIGIVPIGAALTFDDVPNLQRTLIMVPALSILSAIGMNELFNFFQRLKKSKWIFFLTIIIVLYYVSFYLHQYYVHAPVYKPWIRNDGYKALVTKINYYSSSYKKVIITSRESDPSIFFLFYTPYDPKLFQAENKGKDLKDFGLVGFGKYEFSMEECPFPQNTSMEDKDKLYVNSGLCKVPQNAEIVEIIKRGDRSIVFYILKLKGSQQMN